MKFNIIGIDEVGRGALAGPVVVAAVAATTKLRIKKKIKNSKLAKLKDSKKLSPKQREIWFYFIKQQKFPYAIASVYPKIIDKINISNAANLAAAKALKSLIKNYKLRIKNYDVYLDGRLYVKSKILPAGRYGKNQKFINFKTKTIIKGDEKIPAISLASIVAKVHRDKFMKKLHKRYPVYDFIHNVGYGTKKHFKAVKKHGCSPVHRKSFAPCVK